MKRPLLLALVLSCACAALAGCSSPGGAAGTVPSAGGGSPSTDSPPADGATPTLSPDTGDANTAMGYVVLIRPGGFEPHLLLAPFGTPIIWKNLSGTTQSVHLDNFGRRVDSGPIHPGATWSFNPNAQLSIVYHSTYGKHFRGQLQIQLTGNG